MNSCVGPLWVFFRNNGLEKHSQRDAINAYAKAERKAIEFTYSKQIET